MEPRLSCSAPMAFTSVYFGLAPSFSTSSLQCFCIGLTWVRQTVNRVSWARLRVCSLISLSFQAKARRSGYGGRLPWLSKALIGGYDGLKTSSGSTSLTSSIEECAC